MSADYTAAEAAFLDAAGDDRAERARRVDFIAAVRSLVDEGVLTVTEDGRYRQT